MKAPQTDRRPALRYSSNYRPLHDGPTRHKQANHVPAAWSIVTSRIEPANRGCSTIATPPIFGRVSGQHAPAGHQGDAAARRRRLGEKGRPIAAKSNGDASTYR